MHLDKKYCRYVEGFSISIRNTNEDVIGEVILNNSNNIWNIEFIGIPRIKCLNNVWNKSFLSPSDDLEKVRNTIENFLFRADKLLVFL